MSCLQNSRHERFAQFVAQGVKKQDAYEQAGFKVGSNNATKLMRDYPEISQRIKQLQNKRARTMQEADVEDIMDKTEASRILSKMARDEQNGTEQGRRLSLVVLARMYGWNTPEIVEVKNATEMSDEELERMIRENKKKAIDEDDEELAEGFFTNLSHQVRSIVEESEEEVEQVVEDNNKCLGASKGDEVGDEFEEIVIEEEDEDLFEQ